MSPLTALLAYGGNTLEPVGGRPGKRGVLYQLTSDGALHWYRYDGDGRLSPTAPLGDWADGSGNPVGTGRPSTRALVPLGDQMLLSHVGNRLYVQRYLGDGGKDPDGTCPGAWTRRTLVRRGDEWREAAFVVSTPREGSEPSRVTRPAVIRVAPDGGWFWYRYVGPDEPDGRPGSGRNWHAESGNQIRSLPGDFRHVVAAGSVILTVDQDGTLRWHRYTGDGEPWTEPTGGPWHRDSGTVIGHGWDRYSHIAGGTDWDNGGIVLFCVERDSGDLVYHRYTGRGEVSPSSGFAVGPETIGHYW